LKKSISILALAALTLLVATTAFAAEDWRGNNRVSGVVTDKATGQPVKGAKVQLRFQRGGKGGPDTTTDNNGRWAVLGLLFGPWNIDVEAPGYTTRQMSTNISEGQRLPPMKIELEKEEAPQPVAASPTEAPMELVKIGGVEVTAEVAAAIEAGNRLITEQKFKEAVAEYEKAYPVLSSNVGLKFALARAYYGAGELKKAIVLLDEAYKADPSNTQTALLLANMLIEDGQIEKGKELVAKLPAGSVTDPTIFINMAIAAMNKKQPAVAHDYLTKAIALDEKRYESYYYRGLASIQMQKTKQAKPDLEKVIELAPASSEAGEAREYLKSIK
jgi:Flp pilus assembly protein TadD